jgi:adenylate cyclase
MLASFVVVTAYRQLTEERAKRRIRKLFAHALSPALVDRLLADPSVARLGGERRVLSFLFSDLQGFTGLAERMGEQATVQLLNHYFDHMTEVIQNRCGGYLNKFLGDGLFVFFGAPALQDDHAARAVRAAAEIQAEVARLNAEIAGQHDPPVELICRVGLATGEVMVGNCGSTARMDYTAIGDAVNLAARLESANKLFGTRILVAEETWRTGGAGFTARPLGRVRVVGKVAPVAIYELLGPTDELDAAVCDRTERFGRALERYLAGAFSEAAEAFEWLATEDPGDKAAALYLAKARQVARSAPPAGWDGVLELSEK